MDKAMKLILDSIDDDYVNDLLERFPTVYPKGYTPKNPKRYMKMSKEQLREDIILKIKMMEETGFYFEINSNIYERNRRFKRKVSLIAIATGLLLVFGGIAITALGFHPAVVLPFIGLFMVIGAIFYGSSWTSPSVYLCMADTADPLWALLMKGDTGKKKKRSKKKMI